MAGDERERATITVLQAIAFIIGIVIGIGIFRTPQIVAQNVASEHAFIALWIAGGLITLMGALVYAELASAYPSGGGEYHFLTRAFGRPVGLLFAWARVTVIQTGAIAAVAFVYGDYAQQLVPLGPFGPALHAALALLVLTAVNLAGSQQGKGTQLALVVLTMATIAAVVLAGLWTAAGRGVFAPSLPATGVSAPGFAMIFVLLTYGGWNEAAYLSAEIKDARRNMVRVLVLSTSAIAMIYVLMNLAYLSILGLGGLQKSSAVGADAIRAVAGEYGAVAVGFVVCSAALSTLNSSIFIGARLYQAVGNDLPALQRLGLGRVQAGTPRAAIATQGGVALALVVFGAPMRHGFESMVAYTAPVVWLFLLLAGLSLLVLRHREPDRERPFRVPFYPLIPALFCLTCAYLLYSSLADTGLGGFIGVAVLLLGIPVVWLALPRSDHKAE